MATGYQLASMVQTWGDLGPWETLVGIILALAVDRKTQTVRLQRETIAERSRLSIDQVKRALRGLRDKGVITGKRTGRSTIYRFQMDGYKSGRVDGAWVHRLMGHSGDKSPRKRRRLAADAYAIPRRDANGNRLIGEWEMLKMSDEIERR